MLNIATKYTRTIQKNISFYEKWIETEGIPVMSGLSVEDLNKAPLKPWKRKGGLGAYINLEDAGSHLSAYLCEIPPGGQLSPQKHMFEEVIYVLSGRGATTIWNEGGGKQSFEWQEGSLFSPPLNVWHQHFNGQGDRPARYLAVTDAPAVMNLFHNVEFIYNTPFVFRDRYNEEKGYFSSKGKFIDTRVWESNFILDVRQFQLQEWKERGGGGTNMHFEMANGTMGAHTSEFPVGTYKKAHGHYYSPFGPPHLLILSGKGFSLLWRPGEPYNKIDWHAGTLFVPLTGRGQKHQHFNTGKEPARYLAFHSGNKYRMSPEIARVAESTRTGGDQIEYEDEDPAIRKHYEADLAKEGVQIKMPPVIRR